jgi:hypothetical protein
MYNTVFKDPHPHAHTHTLKLTPILVLSVLHTYIGERGAVPSMAAARATPRLAVPAEHS